MGIAAMDLKPPGEHRGRALIPQQGALHFKILTSANYHLLKRGIKGM